MRREERQKLIANAVATLANNPLVPAAARVAAALAAEEMRDQAQRIDELERKLLEDKVQ